MIADTYAQAASARYTALCTRIDATLNSGIRSSIDAGVFRSPANMIKAIGDAYILEETNSIRNLERDIVSKAAQSVSDFYGSVPEETAIHASVAMDTLRVAIVAQVQKLISSANVSFRQFQINAVNVSKTGVDLKKAMRIAEDRATLADRDHVDRRGKVWKGEVYVRTLWRQAYVWSEAQATLSAIADHKKTLAVISHPEEDHKSNGLIVSVTGADGYPTWEQVRDQHFHPNTRAILKPYGG